MTQSRSSGGSPRRPGRFALIGLAVAVLAVGLAWVVGALLPNGATVALRSPAPTAAATSDAEPSPTISPSTAPPPTPIPTPPTVPAPLTGLPVSPEAAAQHPIAIMIDDHVDARPQSGFNAASIVWQAPAEGGVPRYMLIFQDELPASVGPVRSARQYYIEWAAEWRAMYLHHGGSPQANETLARKGQGQLVYDASGFRWLGRYLWRVHDRYAPHDVYTDAEHLRALAERLGVKDGPIEPVWSFQLGADRARRPVGGSIKVVYPYESITYRYDAETNTYLRYLNASKTPQVDRADGKVVAPTNVVILRMRFGPLNDGHPEAHRLEAHNIGTGQAWIATNGRTVKGTWSKASAGAPTLLFGADGTPITLTAGQTFVQVLALSYDYDIVAGTEPAIVVPMARRAEPT